MARKKVVTIEGLQDDLAKKDRSLKRALTTISRLRRDLKEKDGLLERAQKTAADIADIADIRREENNQLQQETVDLKSANVHLRDRAQRAEAADKRAEDLKRRYWEKVDEVKELQRTIGQDKLDRKTVEAMMMAVARGLAGGGE